MKRLTITTICTADVTETWTVDVPDNFDPDDVEDGSSGILDAALEVGNFVLVVDESHNEREREVTGVVDEAPVEAQHTPSASAAWDGRMAAAIDIARIFRNVGHPATTARDSLTTLTGDAELATSAVGEAYRGRA